MDCVDLLIDTLTLQLCSLDYSQWVESVPSITHKDEHSDSITFKTHNHQSEKRFKESRFFYKKVKIHFFGF